MRRKSSIPFWLAAPGVAWLLLFAIAPVVFAFVLSFWRSTLYGTTVDWNIDNYAQILTEPIYLEVLFTTLRISAGTTFLCLVLAYPLAWLLANLGPRRKTILLTALFMPFWISFIIRTFVWLPVLGRNGIINLSLQRMGIISEPLDWLIYNEFALYLGLVYVYFLYMILPLFMSLDKLDRSLLEAASDLGAGRLQTFLRIIFPLSLPGVLSGSVMVFLLCCGAFVTPQLLGGPSAAMFGNLIADQFVLGNNWALGAALSIVLIVVVIVFIALTSRKVGMERIFLQGR